MLLLFDTVDNEAHGWFEQLTSAPLLEFQDTERVEQIAPDDEHVSSFIFPSSTSTI